MKSKTAWTMTDEEINDVITDNLEILDKVSDSLREQGYQVFWNRYGTNPDFIAKREDGSLLMVTVKDGSGKMVIRHFHFVKTD